MAKISVMGDAVVLTSAVKLEDYKKVKKYRPKALVLMGGEDNKEEIFRVGVSGGKGGVNSVGVEFGKETHDAEKLACLTVVLGDIGDKDIKEVIADSYGPALMLLEKIEEKIPAVIAEIDAEKETILGKVNFVQ